MWKRGQTNKIALTTFTIWSTYPNEKEILFWTFLEKTQMQFFNIFQFSNPKFLLWKYIQRTLKNIPSNSVFFRFVLTINKSKWPTQYFVNSFIFSFSLSIHSFIHSSTFRLDTLSEMRAHDELDEEQVRQMIFDVEQSYYAFNRLLQHT